jgi:hypothetical protein
MHLAETWQHPLWLIIETGATLESSLLLLSTGKNVFTFASLLVNSFPITYLSSKVRAIDL